MMTILPVVVLYNADYQQTNVYQSLLSHYPKQRVLLYENSQEPLNAHYGSSLLYYHHNPLNGGVSAAYNQGAVLADQLGNVDALLLLDEDTYFDSGYLDKLGNALEDHPDINLFVPQVYYGSDRQVFSPIHRGTRLKRGARLSEGEYSLRDYLPVNSGACVRLPVFKELGGYNKLIRLDFADFDFFSRLCELSSRFWCIDIEVFQSFSNEDILTERLFCRFRFYVEGAKVASANPLIGTMVKVETLRHTIALTFRTRSLKFICYLINSR